MITFVRYTSDDHERTAEITYRGERRWTVDCRRRMPLSPAGGWEWILVRSCDLYTSLNAAQAAGREFCK